MEAHSVISGDADSSMLPLRFERRDKRAIGIGQRVIVKTR
jgi:hypothetical protein